MTGKMKFCQLPHVSPSLCTTRVTSDCVCCVIINVINVEPSALGTWGERQDVIHAIILFTSFVHVNCNESSTACSHISIRGDNK